MATIVPHLWFKHSAPEAVAFYTSVFDDSAIQWQTTLHDTPDGDSEQLAFTLLGIDFYGFADNPVSTFTRSLSLSVLCQTREERAHYIQLFQAKGSEIATDSLVDPYGLTWHFLIDETNPSQRILPTIQFKDATTRQEALAYYPTVFEKSRVIEEKDKDPILEIEGFRILFHVVEGEPEAFTESFSFEVNCPTQERIDYYWEQLSADPEAEACGWVKDRFGISWQIGTSEMDAMLQTDDEEAKARAVQALLPMKKIDIEAIKRAFSGIE